MRSRFDTNSNREAERSYFRSLDQARRSSQASDLDESASFYNDADFTNLNDSLYYQHSKYLPRRTEAKTQPRAQSSIDRKYSLRKDAKPSIDSSSEMLLPTSPQMYAPIEARSSSNNNNSRSKGRELCVLQLDPLKSYVYESGMHDLILSSI